ncbi:MAG TPA: VIT domain-containing protein [Polyangiaceae bacterium]|nr:VIT domain-containing protein [Polyangiaceae bacterium]
MISHILGYVRAGRIRRSTLGAAMLVAVVAGGSVGWRAGWVPAPAGWQGRVAHIVRGGGGVTLKGWPELAEGATLPAGATVATDRKQRARLEMSDGTVLVLDRDTEVEFDKRPNSRVVHVRHGVVVADVAAAHPSAGAVQSAAEPARFVTQGGEVVAAGTELTLTATDESTDVQVTRGSANAKGGGRETEVEAGQEALFTSAGVELAPIATAAGTGLGGELIGELGKPQSEDGSAGAVGELRARRPGHDDEKDRALRIASTAVRVRIAGAMARTEVEQTFANDENEDLEGIYRFPVPPGALVDRLALDVDGKLVEGSFVEKKRAEGILRGAIATATPVRRVRDDIVWVPGPWRDPALLEWQQGGRFELRIFPVPRHGTRRVVIGYTQTVSASLGTRRYLYPLPTAGAVRIGDFSVDAQVLGADPAVPIRTRGYDLSASGEHLSLHEAGFSPSGDLVIEYGLPNRKSALSAWTFESGSDRFVALALRPKLPPSAESRPRDWVVAVDAGRSMFGERFSRASRVAVALAGTLDRRDRLTVLACDTSCKQSGDLAPAGAAAAKTSAHFLETLTPDGASDLVGMVRSAAALGAADRELRVVLVSDGLASAGYERPSRLAEEVSDAMGSRPGAALFAVPIGSDADENTLAEMARGGGGVVIPYAPGEAASDVAVAVAGAGAGALLREAAVELPEGLSDVAPASLPTLRAGGETYVVARMGSADLKGDVVVHGRLGAEPFEARLPVELHSTTDAGNAFVPRLFASTRIRDLERGSSDSARAEAIALAQRFSVPSRFVSLLVLESEAMFKAFGIDRGAAAPLWTGEQLATGTDVGKNEEAEQPSTAGLLGGASGAGDGFADLAAKRAAPAPTATSEAATDELAAPSAHAAPRVSRWREFRPRGRLMRRVFHREATIAAADGGAALASDQVAAARAALAIAPDDRSKHRALARALERRGSLDELEQVLLAWQKRDPLDPDAITMRADLLAERGDRKAAARVVSGVASSDPSRLDDLALGAERLGDGAAACSLRIAAAERRPDDAARVALAIRCERAAGRSAAADRWLRDAGASARAIEATLSKQGDPARVSGDVIVNASWNGGADLDVAVIDPNGQRLGWMAGRGRVIDATSLAHEKVGVASGSAGTFLVEISRASGDSDPISGFIDVSAFGANKRVPFVLAGSSARVARIDARWVAQLVPTADPSSVE